MQIVIDIPERIHYGIEKDITVNGSEASQILIDAVKNGTPLPKGHGRLIDADLLLVEADELKMSPWYNNDINGSYAVRKDAVSMIEDLCVKNAPTIIEADRTESE